jgi:hypothetical protein
VNENQTVGYIETLMESNAVEDIKLQIYHTAQDYKFKNQMKEALEVILLLLLKINEILN